MKRYSSGLYARLGFSVAIHANPDIVLVDEVLAVGDAAFRRRALEALRSLIADGKTVLFISHDMWNVRRLCDQILWMEEGRVRAYGPAAEIAERYMSEVNLQALANQGTALQSHRGGTGEIRYTRVEIVDADGRPSVALAPGDTLVVRAAYRAERPVARPVFQVAIVDVDTGLVITTATSRPNDVPDAVGGLGTIECRFPRLPLRPRQHLACRSPTLISSPYDLAGRPPLCGERPRFCRQPADEEDGPVSLPFEFARITPVMCRYCIKRDVGEAVVLLDPHGGSAGNVWTAS
jgi:ABC-2 type transport system ATP-binding protein